MDKIVLIDTNLLLDDSNILFKLSKQFEKILISRIVLKELDKHKYNPDLSYSARNAIQAIKQFKDEHPNRLLFHVGEEVLDNNDALILKAGKEHNAVVATKDISMSIIAEAEGLEADLYDVVLNNIYNPYHYVDMYKIYEKYQTFGFQQCYEAHEYHYILDVFSEIVEHKLNCNSWFFIFIQTEKKRPVVFANNPFEKHLRRIDNEPRYLQIEIENGKTIRSLDMYQNCAIYALKEAPNVLLTGRWGSGKTLLSTANSISETSKKLFITRPPIGINSKYDIGFFPGKKEEKMMDWLSGFTSSLYFIYGNTNGQTNGGNGYNYVTDILFNQLFEVLPLNSIQGLSLLENDILLIDEVQLLSVDYMSMLLSRSTKSGKLILMGDLKQTYSIVKPSESGLLKLLRVLPHKSLAYVDLQTSYRSDLLEVADMLQDRTIG